MRSTGQGVLSTTNRAVCPIDRGTGSGCERRLARSTARSADQAVAAAAVLSARFTEPHQPASLDNRLWGTERIRGELLKLGIVVSNRSIRGYRWHGPSRSLKPDLAHVLDQPCPPPLGVLLHRRG